MQYEPYFLKNPEWYREMSLAESKRGYVLTDQAPPEAVESYREFYGDETDDNGQIKIINK